MLLVGADLLNSRLLYTSLPGFAFLLACAVQALPRMGLAAALAIALFYAAALQHNLAIRARVARSAAKPAPRRLGAQQAASQLAW